MAKKPPQIVVEIGRDAVNGRFIPVEETHLRPRETIIQHIHRPVTPLKPTKR